MNKKNNSTCHTHTYLTGPEESSLAKLILEELRTSGNHNQKASRPLPAPSEMCDLIF